jgi:hypothetical protein
LRRAQILGSMGVRRFVTVFTSARVRTRICSC